MKSPFIVWALFVAAMTSACSSRPFRGSEADSGPDQVLGGAVPLAANATHKDSVGYKEEDQTDWYLLKGENQEVELTFLSSSHKELTAKVYRVFGKAKARGKPRVLKVGKVARFSLKKDDLYIQVEAAKKSAKLSYSIIRKDLTAGGTAAKMAKIAVIDLYPLSDSKSLVLLKASDDVKVGSTLAISGQNGSEKMESLGDCEVSSVTGDQASCTLPSLPKLKYARYRAVLAN